MGVQVFEDDDNEAFFFLDGKTVLVEKDLNFDSKLKGRKNFTLMHEGSHQIFKMLFPNDYGVTQKSAGVHYYKANSERNKPISDWEEWQANTLGAAILLPENLINTDCGLKEPSMVMLEQLRTVDKATELDNFVGRITDADKISEIKRGLKFAVGIPVKPKTERKGIVLSLCPRCRSEFQSIPENIVKDLTPFRQIKRCAINVR